MENNYLCHYGRKGMKRGQHIFGKDDAKNSSGGGSSNFEKRGGDGQNDAVGRSVSANSVAGREANKRRLRYKAQQYSTRGQAFVERIMRGGKSRPDVENSQAGARLARNSKSGRSASERFLVRKAKSSNKKSNTSQEYRDEKRYNSRKNN